MRSTLKFLAATLLVSLGLKAQGPVDSVKIRRSCGTHIPPAAWDSWFNQKVEEHKQSQALGKAENTSWTISLIVHVVHGGEAVGAFPNLSALQIYSQIKVMNDDYAGQGYNSGSLAATAFSAVGAADCHITFCVAQKDQNGNDLAEAGIDRVDYTMHTNWSNPSTLTSQTAFQNFIDNTVKPATIWDPTSYYNIWISDVNNGVGLLGYSTFPAGSGLSGLPSLGTSTDDGIWIWAKAFGITGILAYPYNKGRTASHETGHYLGLRHIGGDGNNNSNGDCSATDYCNDTPPQLGGFDGGQYGQNFGAPVYPLFNTGTKSCTGAPNGNMFMNFMDYVDDPSCYMFTPDQSARMAVAMNNGTYRKQLNASPAGCSIILGVEKMSLLDRAVTLSPNPSSGLVNLTTSLAGSQNLDVVIRNYLGQFITSISYKSADVSTQTIDMTGYANGVYFVTVTNGQQKTVKRLILNK